MQTLANQKPAGGSPKLKARLLSGVVAIFCAMFLLSFVVQPIKAETEITSSDTEYFNELKKIFPKLQFIEDRGKVSLPDLTQRQLNFQNNELKRLLKNTDIKTELDFYSQEKMGDEPIFCSEFINFLTSDLEMRLPKFDFVASGDNASKIANKYVRRSYNFSNIAYERDIYNPVYPYITTQEEMEQFFVFAEFIFPMIKEIDWVDQAGNIPLFDYQSLIAKPGRQILIRKNPTGSYPFIYLYRPDRSDENSRISYEVKFIDDRGQLVDPSERFLTFDNVKKLPDFVNKFFLDSSDQVTVDPVPTKEFYRQERPDGLDYIDFGVKVDVRRLDGFKNLNGGLFAFGNKIFLWSFDINRSSSNHGFVWITSFDRSNSTKLKYNRCFLTFDIGVH